MAIFTLYQNLDYMFKHHRYPKAIILQAVAGNCGMSETRIEKAAKSLKGVSVADWNQETKMIEVTFDESITDVHAIHKAIAKVGHDTDKYAANDEVYGKLPGCCKYERLTNDKK